jgi:hypothetical protein
MPPNPGEPFMSWGSGSVAGSLPRFILAFLIPSSALPEKQKSTIRIPGFIAQTPARSATSWCFSSFFINPYQWHFLTVVCGGWFDLFKVQTGDG